MCTTGALRLGSDEYLIFKNKDFGRPSFEDRLVVEQGVFGIAGITTWAGTDPDLDEFSGFSIGANRDGLLACDSNVRTLPGHDNYDRLVEIALREGHDVESGVEAVRRATSLRPFLWANLVLIDGSSIVAVEVRGQQVEVSIAADRIARSNHHVVLGAHEADDDTVTSEPRLASASARLDRAGSLDDIFALQASHDHGGTGICNHSLYDTVYSYVIRHRPDGVALFVVKGHPCEMTERLELTIPVGPAWAPEAADAFRERYPSERAGVPVVNPDRRVRPPTGS